MQKVTKYKRLGLSQRYQISVYYEQGMSMSQIAEKIGVHKSTVSREMNRNTPQGGKGAHIYDAERADTKAANRKFNKARRCDLEDWMLDYIRLKMKVDRWSPELISAIGKREFGTFISQETIYLYIWCAKHSKHRYYADDRDLHQYLRHGKRRQKRSNRKQNRGCIPNRVPISERPLEVENRNSLGDIEVDIMMGKAHKPGLLVLTDRSSLETELIKLETKRADVVAKKIITRLSKKKQNIHSLTFDNDLAFAQHEKIAKKLNVSTYFTRPYTSQDKGTVENRIGQIRRFFPKGQCLRSTHPSTIRSVQNKINQRPIRKFNYLNAIEKRNLFLNNVALVT